MDGPADDNPNELERLRRELAELRERHSALERHAAMLEASLSAAPVALSIKEPGDEGRYLWVNAVWERAFGKPAAEAVGKTDRELWPGESAEALARADAEVIGAGRAVEGVISVPGGAGRREWVSWRFPLHDANGRLLLGGCSLEAGKPGAAGRGCNSLEHRLLCESRSGMIGILYGEDDRIVEANDVFLRMLGYGRKRLGEGLSLTALAAPGSASSCEAARREIETAGTLHLREVELLRADGSILPAGIGGAVLDRSPRLSWVLYVLDMAEQRRAERRLRRDEAWERLGLFAAGLAHDFNNLLVVIIGNASMAASEVSASRKVKQYAQEVLTAAEQAAALVRQLLACSGKARITPARVAIGDIVRRAASAGAVPEDVELEMDVPADLPPVSGDPAQLQDAVRSVVVNALEAAGPRGVVRVGARACRLEEPAEFPDTELGPGGYICVSVEDSGPGMDERTQQRIFDPFFTTKFHGRGLGLAAAYGIVRRHGGGIRVESAPGRGSRFEIMLPVAAA